MRRGFKLSTDITINTGLLVVESSNIDCWDDILNAVGDVSGDRVFINVPVCGFKTVLESGNGFLTRFFLIQVFIIYLFLSRTSITKGIFFAHESLYKDKTLMHQSSTVKRLSCYPAVCLNSGSFCSFVTLPKQLISCWFY